MGILPLDILIKHYPAGFMQQLGEQLDTVVGFGKTTSRKRKNRDMPNVRIIASPVQTADEVLGDYKILLVDGRVASLSYNGIHPTKSKGERRKIAVRIGPNYDIKKNGIPNEQLGRMDHWNTILFPGINGNPTFKYNQVEHWAYVDGYAPVRAVAGRK